jgi:two-component sensor histidine kinase
MKKSRSPKETNGIQNTPQSPGLTDGLDFFNVIPVPVFYLDTNLLIKKMNYAASLLFGETIINVPFFDLFQLKPGADKAVSITVLLNNQELIKHEVSFTKDGKQYNFVMSASQPKGNKKIDSGYIITLTDITEQVDDHKKVTAELEEKIILLKEIHHRIKNNLQIINSILTLQMYYAKNEELTVLLTGLQARIRTIALIHEKLYQTENLSEINIGYFLKDLQNILVQIYELNTNSIVFRSDIEEIELDTDTVLQVGLIVNELITNSVKYAFPLGNGNIHTSFKIIGNKYELCYKDDGIGIPEEFLSHTTETLGSQLLETLVEQLNGTVKINVKNGTEYIISFPCK